MAVINAVTTYPNTGVIVVTWSNMATGDTGSWEQVEHFSDKTIQTIIGTPGVAQSVVIQGSNEPGTPANPVTINRLAGASLPLSYTSAGPFIDAVMENPLKIRPNVAGTGMAGVNVILVCSTNRQ